MTDIMKLADDYAAAQGDARADLGANAGMDEQDPMWIAMNEARAALQAAIEALQGENERLKKQEIERLLRIETQVDGLIAERDALAAELAVIKLQVPSALTNLLAYVLQDDMHNRLTPRVIDIAYTAFTLAKQPNTEDGGASDWFNDTKPSITKLIAKLQKDLAEELDAAPKAQEPLTEERVTEIYNEVCADWVNRYNRPLIFARAIEAAHGIGGTP